MKKPLRVREEYREAIEKWVKNIDNNIRMTSNEMHKINDRQTGFVLGGNYARRYWYLWIQGHG